MSFVTIALLTPDEARGLRQDAERVLLSARKRPICKCDEPIADGSACFKCGRAFGSRLVGFLRWQIRQLERIEYDATRKSCPSCGEEMRITMGREGGAEFWWCRRCEARSDYERPELSPMFTAALGFKASRHRGRRARSAAAANHGRYARKPKKRWSREVHDWGSASYDPREKDERAESIAKWRFKDEDYAA